ncbi:hypothetical protein PIROE2DRAFT_12317 [Piromyces sp. E2]|nr:hypothetical protein PIROE2DRAFT_12317 [Piromyces sp. E2]|eukprot:OUM61623.1 hypothetical protein PIROE2DRAFT_12317 [Piromyces sp. E2]
MKNFNLKSFYLEKQNKFISLAYRYLLCAKVIEKLKEYEIKPSYERLHNIITSNINKYWTEELCMNKQYSHICHYEDNIISKVEKFFK